MSFDVSNNIDNMVLAASLRREYPRFSDDMIGDIVGVIREGGWLSETEASELIVDPHPEFQRQYASLYTRHQALVEQYDIDAKAAADEKEAAAVRTKMDQTRIDELTTKNKSLIEELTTYRDEFNKISKEAQDLSDRQKKSREEREKVEAETKEAESHASEKKLSWRDKLRKGGFIKSKEEGDDSV